MKKEIITSLFIILGVFQSMAQDIAYDFYVGTWKYENTSAGDEFIIQLKKMQCNIPAILGGGTENYLVGVYQYKKNGIIVANNMNQLNEYKEVIEFPIRILAGTSYKNMFLRVSDYYLKNGYGEYKTMGGTSRIEYLSSSPKTIRWVIVDNRHEPGMTWDPKDVYPKGTYLPKDIILTKVE